MKDKIEITDFQNRPSGMKVPEGYFVDFNERMETLIDDSEQNNNQRELKKGLVVTLKPWLYIAAMVGFFAFVFNFLLNIDSVIDQSTPASMLSMADDEGVIEDAVYASVGEYALFEYWYAEGE